MWGDKQNNSFWSPKVRAPRFGEEKRKEEEEEGEGEEDQNSGMKSCLIWVFGFLGF